MLEQSFIDTYEKQAEAVFRHCYFRVYDRELARELMQEAFTKTWQYLAEGKEVQNIRAFIYTTANNLVIDLTRRKKEMSLEALQEIGFVPSTNPNDTQNKTDAGLVIRQLYELGEEYRDVVYMRYVDGLKPREIAEITGISVNLISVRIHRGLRILRERCSQ